MSDQSTLRKFADKDYRDGYLNATVRGWIAYQVQALREKLGMTQTEFAAKVGTTQTVISRMENDKGVPNVQTLLDMASELNVALVVQFVSYPDFLARTADMGPTALQPATIDESLRAPSSRKAEEIERILRDIAKPPQQKEVDKESIYRRIIGVRTKDALHRRRLTPQPFAQPPSSGRRAIRPPQEAMN